MSSCYVHLLLLQQWESLYIEIKVIPFHIFFCLAFVYQAQDILFCFLKSLV